MTTDEYLEKLFADAFKRESDQEENVVRSLPFFATSLALVSASIGILRIDIPPFDWSVVAVLVHACLVGIGLTVAVTLVFLYQATRPRRFRYPARESKIIEYADQLRAYHEKAGLSGDKLDAAVQAKLRSLIIKQCSEAAMHSRQNNARRSLARGRAASVLIVNLGLTFVLAAVVIFHMRVRGDAHMLSKPSPSQVAAPALQQQNPSPDHPTPPPMREVSKGAWTRTEQEVVPKANEEGQHVMPNSNSDNDSKPAPEPAPNTSQGPVPEPAAPPMEEMVKGTVLPIKQK